jgi:hypothetical protein
MKILLVGVSAEGLFPPETTSKQRALRLKEALVSSFRLRVQKSRFCLACLRKLLIV